MVTGPLERLGARLEELEARLGRKPAVVRRRATMDVRQLSRFEQDLLGHALVAEERGRKGEMQGYLDRLAEHLRKRLHLARRDN